MLAEKQKREFEGAELSRVRGAMSERARKEEVPVVVA